MVANDYRCSRCRRYSPAQMAALARYHASEKGKRAWARKTARRVRMGHLTCYAATREEALRLRAWAQAQTRAFQSQQRQELARGAES
jgi:hypothetical protein